MNELTEMPLSIQRQKAGSVIYMHLWAIGIYMAKRLDNLSYLSKVSSSTFPMYGQPGCILAPIVFVTLWPVAELLTGCHKVIGLKWRH